MASLRIVFKDPVVVDGQAVTELIIDVDHLAGYGGRVLVWDGAADNIRRIEPAMTGRAVELRRKHPNHGKAWRPEEIAELVRLFGDGVGFEVLTARFGRSRSGVRQALIRAGVLSAESGE